MKGSLLRSRAPAAAGAAAPLARGHGTSTVPARRAAPVARAAMVEELEAMSTDAAFDKDDAYRRFEALLGEADIAFATGDKVRRARSSGARNRASPSWAAAAYARARRPPARASDASPARAPASHALSLSPPRR